MEAELYVLCVRQKKKKKKERGRNGKTSVDTNTKRGKLGCFNGWHDSDDLTAAVVYTEASMTHAGHKLHSVGHFYSFVCLCTYLRIM